MAVATQTFTQSVQGTVSFTGSVLITPGEVIVISESIPNPSTNLQFTSFAFLKAKLQAIGIYSDENLELYTNAASGGAYQDHISLVGGVPYIWTTSSYTANPFVSNVTALYVTNTNAATTLIINVCLDAT